MSATWQETRQEISWTSRHRRLRLRRAPTGSSRRMASSSADALAICLTGQARWFALSLANLRQFVLRFVQFHWRGFYVGPADLHFSAARTLLEAGAGRAGGGRFARWCAAALALVDALESSLWARYFRFEQRGPPHEALRWKQVDSTGAADDAVDVT